MGGMYPTLQLAEGREKNAQFWHPWIFSRAFTAIPKDIAHGALVRVVDSRGTCVGVGTFSAHTSIAVRLWDFTDTVIDQVWIEHRLRAAQQQREANGYGPNTQTTGYRLIFAEADQMPGVVIDRFDTVFVLQIATAGADALKPLIVQALMKIFQPTAIVERSDAGAREEEQLKDSTSLLHGNCAEEIPFVENGHRAIAHPLTGQKTGYFADQKELRRAIQQHAAGKTVVNIFSYTGMAGVYAMAGGATSVHHVDSSAFALQGCEAHRVANAIEVANWTTEEADVFQWLSARKEPAYDMVCIDPPALIKSQRDVEEGKKAYHFLNRAAMRLTKDSGIFVTSSCSHFFPEEDLLFTLRRASVQNRMRLHILGSIRQAPDHPASVYVPESQYLKSVVCRVERLS